MPAVKRMRNNPDTTYSQLPRAQAIRTGTYLGLILGLGACLRLATLGRQSLWLDESFSYWMANRSWTALLASLPFNDTHPPLYYLSLQPMIALGGSEWVLRLPSALFSVVSIGLVFALGKELFNRTTALIAAFIVAIAPIQIWFAQEARMYALVSMLALAAGLFAVRALRTNRWPDWLMLGLCEGLALLTDIAALWFVIAVNVAWLLAVKAHWRSGRFWPWLMAQLFAFCLYLPWVPGLLQQLSNGITNWIPPATVTIMARTLTDFTGSYEQRSTPESLLTLIALVTPFVLAARGLFREMAARKMAYLLLGCWFFIPIGLAFLISQPYISVPLLSLLVGQGRSIFLTRNLIVASFPLYLLLARSLTLSPRRARFVILAALVMMSGVSYYQNVLHDSKEDFRAAAQIVTAQAVPSDLILFAPPYIELPFAYYYNRSPGVEVSFDTLTEGVISNQGFPANTSPGELLSHYQRVWLITSSDNIYRVDTAHTKETLDARGSVLDAREVYGVSILLYRLNKPN